MLIFAKVKRLLKRWRSSATAAPPVLPMAYASAGVSLALASIPSAPATGSSAVTATASRPNMFADTMRMHATNATAILATLVTTSTLQAVSDVHPVMKAMVGIFLSAIEAFERAAVQLQTARHCLDYVGQVLVAVGHRLAAPDAPSTVPETQRFMIALRAFQANLTHFGASLGEICGMSKANLIRNRDEVESTLDSIWVSLKTTIDLLNLMSSTNTALLQEQYGRYRRQDHLQIFQLLVRIDDVLDQVMTVQQASAVAVADVRTVVDTNGMKLDEIIAKHKLSSQQAYAATVLTKREWNVMSAEIECVSYEQQGSLKTRDPIRADLSNQIVQDYLHRRQARCRQIFERNQAFYRAENFWWHEKLRMERAAGIISEHQAEEMDKDHQEMSKLQQQFLDGITPRGTSTPGSSDTSSLVSRITGSTSSRGSLFTPPSSNSNHEHHQLPGYEVDTIKEEDQW